MANNTFETYVELLPKTWFAHETPRHPRMLLSGSVLLSELEAFEKANIIFSKRMDTRVVLEPHASGREFK